MGVVPTAPMAFVDPRQLAPGSPCPPLALIRAETWSLEDLEVLKQRQGRSVHLAFPVKDEGEADNLRHLAAHLDPLAGRLIDRGWLACSAADPGALSHLSQEFPWLQVVPVCRTAPPDQGGVAWGKGAAMRALLYHLVVAGAVRHPRALVQFLDADIRPAFFGPAWCLGPVGALLWFEGVEAAKTVYFRPRGGRLNTFVRSLLATLPHPGLQRLQDILYLLSGEMAATLRFWSAIPFKSGYGIEIQILLRLALDLLRLHPGRSDVASLVQVYVGQMDHRHAPLRSNRGRAGLDQMAAAVFTTIWEVLQEAGLISWSPDPAAWPGTLRLPLPAPGPGRPPRWLTVPLREDTLPPLASLAAVAAALEGG